MQQTSKLQWHLVLLVTFGTLVVLVLAHVLFVAFYAHLMNTGHDQAFYSEFAQHTGTPFVFFFAPVPIFLIVRWVGRKAPHLAMKHALLIVAVSVALDVAIIALVGKAAMLLNAGPLLAHAAKVAAMILGGWVVQKERA